MTAQFDFVSGKWEAENGMELALESNRVQEWKEHAERWMMSKPCGFEFTADDLIYAIGVPSEGANKNNVVGAWFNAKSKSKAIFWTGRVKHSSRVSRHTGLHRVWTIS